MHEYILKFNSYTTAMNAQNVLSVQGMRTQVKKATVSSEGCIYFIKVSDIERAQKILSDNNISYTSDYGNSGAI